MTSRNSGGRWRRGALAAAVGAGTIVLGASVAGAASIVLEADFDLTGAGPPVNSWDPDGSGSSFNISDGYQPVDDGQIVERDGDERDDAFDDGLMLQVGTSDYDPENSAGDTIGNVFHSGFGPGVRTPARTLEGLRVSRVDVVRGAGSPTMRNLVRLKNNSNNARVRDITWESDVGSNGSSAYRRTSSGNLTHGPSDRWVVSSDSATTPSDPVVTHVFFGKGARKKVTDVNNALGSVQVDRLSVSLDNIRVPANSTRYLLLFAEMNVSNDSAIDRARKFNRNNKVERQLLGGISDSVRNRIVNWDF